jgi:hypothetical protein
LWMLVILNIRLGYKCQPVNAAYESNDCLLRRYLKNSLWADVKLSNVCNVGTKGNHKVVNI